MERLKYDNIFDAIEEDSHASACLEFRANLMLILRDICFDRNLNGHEIEDALNITSDKVDELLKGKVQKFTADVLIEYLSKLGVRFKPEINKIKEKEYSVVCTVLCR